MHKKLLLFVMAGLVCSPAFAGQSGKLKICRHPGLTELMDGKKVHIPSDTYTGACDKFGEHCRNIQIKGDAATLGAAKNSCVTVNATLLHSDGKPIKKGDHLVEQWNIPGFTPMIHAATDFK